MRSVSSLMLPMLIWGGALGLGMWRGGFSAWFLFFCLSGALAYSLLVLLFSLRRVEVSRVMAGSRFVAGEDVLVTLSVKQRSWLPVAWMVVKDGWIREPASAAGSHRKLLFPWFRSSFTYQYAIRGLRRGTYRFQELEICAGDLLGFAVKCKKLKHPQSFVVYPQALDVRQEPVAAHGLQGGKDAHSMEPATVPQIGGIRDYAEGDPLNRIHWKSSARTGTLKTKLEEPVVMQDMFVVLDSGGPSGHGEGHAYGERYGYGDGQAYGERHGHPAYDERYSYGEASAYDERYGYGDAPAYGGRHRRARNHARDEQYRRQSAAFETCVEVAAGLLQYACRNKTGFGLLFTGGSPATLPFSFQPPQPEAGMELLSAVGPGTGHARAGQLPQELLLLPRQVAIVWVTPRLDETLAGQLGILCEQGRHVLVLFVRTAPVLSWQERQGKRRLESVGCAFGSVLCPPGSDRAKAGVEDVGA